MTTRRDLFRAAAGVLLLPRHLLAAERPQLEVALKAERWIRTARIDTEHGANWPADPANPKSVGRDLYNGYPGVIAFLLELYHATGDRHFLDEASRGATELAAGIAEAEDAGLYTGLAGIGFVLAEMHRASGAARHRTAARLALDTVKQRARPVGRGVQWSESADIISGSAGTGLYLLWAAKHFDDPAAVALAARA
ncbi:MAG TPA: lanthionine synthetase LanC family protein, partial [Longimicrobiales bacterium]|nr:lanthionine synthetase LanC family protein [Longimicrobiales bacterium]